MKEILQESNVTVTEEGPRIFQPIVGCIWEWQSACNVFESPCSYKRKDKLNIVAFNEK